MYEIIYGNLISKKELKKISVEVLFKIKKQIELKLTNSPENFGKPLRKSLKGYRRLRVGNFRVIFKIKSSKKIIQIVFIGKKPDVYTHFLKKK